MRLTLSKASLLALLSRCGAVVEPRPTMPVLAHLLLVATATALEVTGTDLEVEARAVLEADPTDLVVTMPGTLTAPADRMLDIVRKLPDGGRLELEYDRHTERLTLRAGRYRAMLPTLPVENFPRWPAAPCVSRFYLRVDALADLIGRSRFCIGKDETRYYLTGLYLHVAAGPSGRVLRGAATNSHILSRVDIALPAGAADMPGVIIPGKTIGLLAKLLAEKSIAPETAVELSVCATQIIARLPGLTLASRLVDGTYPEYERVIPESGGPLAATISIDRELLAATLDRIGSIRSDKTDAIKMTLSGGKLTVSASSPGAGSASETLDEAGSGSVEIGVNGRYAHSVLAAMGGDIVQMDIIDPASPIRTTNPSDDSGLFIVMPMRVT